MAGTLADLDAVGAHRLELLDHGTGLVRRIALVPVAQRLGPAEAEHQAGPGLLVGVYRLAAGEQDIDSGVAAGVAHGGDAVAEVKPEGVVEGAGSEAKVGAGQ